MSRAKPPATKSSPRRQTHTWALTPAARRKRAADDGFEIIAILLDAARAGGVPKRGDSPSRPSKKRAAGAEKASTLATLIAGTKTDDAQLRALAAAAQREVALPADAFLIGEPVEVVTIEYSGHPRAGLSASCRRAGENHHAGLADVAFPPGSDGARFVSLYRAWLGLAELSTAPNRSTASAKRPKAGGDDVALGQPLDLIVLACKANALRCRIPGTARELTLRTAVRDEVPGELITVSPNKQWTHAGHPYLSGDVQASRVDVPALGLTPLELHEFGEWDPDDEYWGEDNEPIAAWAKPIIARGKRPMFEFEQVVPGEDPEDIDSDPILEASELHASGAHAKARAAHEPAGAGPPLPGRPRPPRQPGFESST